MSKQPDPLDLLPAPLRASARDRAGRALVFLWILVAGSLIAFAWRPPAPVPVPVPVPDSAPAPGSAPAPVAVEVRGDEAFVLRALDAAGARAFEAGGERLVLARDGAGLVARAEGGRVLLRAERDEEQVRVVDGGGAPVLRLKVREDGEGYALRGPDGALLCRVKPKPDKVNVYDAGGARVRHGKRKGGVIVVRDAQDRPVLTVDGEGDLGRAGLLAAPVPPLQRALLWATLAGG